MRELKTLRVELRTQIYNELLAEPNIEAIAEMYDLYPEELRNTVEILEIAKSIDKSENEKIVPNNRKEVFNILDEPSFWGREKMLIVTGVMMIISWFLYTAISGDTNIVRPIDLASAQRIILVTGVFFFSCYTIEKAIKYQAPAIWAYFVADKDNKIDLTHDIETALTPWERTKIYALKFGLYLYLLVQLYAVKW